MSQVQGPETGNVDQGQDVRRLITRSLIFLHQILVITLLLLFSQAGFAQQAPDIKGIFDAACLFAIGLYAFAMRLSGLRPFVSFLWLVRYRLLLAIYLLSTIGVAALASSVIIDVGKYLQQDYDQRIKPAIEKREREQDRLRQRQHNESITQASSRKPAGQGAHPDHVIDHSGEIAHDAKSLASHKEAPGLGGADLSVNVLSSDSFGGSNSLGGPHEDDARQVEMNSPHTITTY